MTDRPELPPPPADLMGALHGKVHEDLPGGRAAKSVKAASHSVGPDPIQQLREAIDDFGRAAQDRYDETFRTRGNEKGYREAEALLLAAVSALAAGRDRFLRATRVREDYPFHCDSCGAPHNLDTSIPSEIWNQIAPNGGMLCMLCIDERCAALGLKADAEFYFVGEAVSGRLYDASIGDLQCLRAERDRLQQQLVTLAKLAHPEPQFFNPVEAWEAERLRDRVLGLSPEGRETR